MKKRSMENLMSHTASMSNPPKGYGSIKCGLAVARYRNQRLVELDWPRTISYEDAVTRIEAEILEKFGAPK